MSTIVKARRGRVRGHRASANQRLVLTAIPAGIGSNGKLKISLVISPQLGGSSTLGDFPDFLAWTTAFASQTPHLTLAFNGMSVSASVDQDSLKPDLWAKLFNRDTPVQAYSFNDYRGNLVISYRTRNSLSALKNVYQTWTAYHPQEDLDPVPGPGRHLRSLLSGFVAIPNYEPDTHPSIADLVHQLRVQLYERQAGRGTTPPAPLLDPELSSASPLDPATVRTAATDYLLYQRMPPAFKRPPLPQTAENFAALFDFHLALASLGSYPALQRALGLVLDATVPSEAVLSAGVAGIAAGTLTVQEFSPGAGWRMAPQVLAPPVLYRLSRGADQPGVFAPAESATTSGAPPVSEGFLNLDPQRCQLLQVDLDGAMAKVIALANTWTTAWDTTSAPATLPALRSGGMGLAVDNRAAEVLQSVQRSGSLHDAAGGKGQLPPLFATDLVKGYRVDVWTSLTGRWHSLHRRRAQYRLGADLDGALDVEEEGFNQLAAASPAPDPTRDPQTDVPGLKPVDTDLYVHERLARWAGWSLSAPRPGRPLNRDANPHKATEDDPSLGQPLTPFAMTTAFTPVPGSLPRLRFGSYYRFRVRAVDLAGNSPEPTEREAGPASFADFPSVLPPYPGGTPYLRWEPVPHPTLVLHKIADGARPALNRLIIRSFNSDPSRDTTASPETDDRHVAPPRCSVDLAETHGMLDGPAGFRADPQTFAMLVARDDAAFPATQMGDPPTAVPIDPSDIAALPYMPDPLARAAALRDLPGVAPGTVLQAGSGDIVAGDADPDPGAGPVLQVSFGDQWPDRQCFRILLQDGDGPPQWDPSTRLLTLQLPKAASVTSQLSSSLAEADLAVMGLWAWARQYVDAQNFQALALGGEDLAARLEQIASQAGRLHRLAREGGHWALTPSIPLNFVHAVQQPIGVPAFAGVPPGTWALTEREQALSPARDCSPFPPLAAWRQRGATDVVLIGGLHCHFPSSAKIDIQATWTDVIDEGGHRELARAAHVESLPLTGLPRDELLSPAADGGRALAVYLTPKALLWFAPNYVDQSGNPHPAAAPIHRLADTRFRMITYQAVATSRFQDDFPQDQGLDFTRTSPPLTIEVPSSARPATPSVRYVIPTFGWRRHQGGTVWTSVRLGQGLRVYLDRPWFSSGHGGLLGVVVWNGEDTPSDGDRDSLYKTVFTQWGLDPLRLTGPLAGMPKLGDFPDAALSATALRIPETGRLVDVAGHSVGFDADRQLWYADITINAQGAHRPFVRMALVRFQPHSIPGVELSTPVLADFAQLTPDRSAILVNDPAAPAVYTLIVSGLAPKLTPTAPWGPQITVTIEQRRTDIGGDLGWEEVSANVASAIETASPPNAPAALWAGFIAFAAPPPASTFRAVIREYEYYQSDGFIPIFLNGRLFDPAVLAPSPAASLAKARALNAERLAGAAPVGSDAILQGALGRLQGILWGVATTARLVYAEVIPIEPPAPAADPTGEPVGGVEPGGGDEQPPWPPYGGPPAPHAPDWTAQPALDVANDLTVIDPDVKLAQAMLNAAGAASPALIIDGKFGPATAAAVKAFRAANQFPDGTAIDTDIWLALALAAPFPQLEQGVGLPAMQGPPIAVVQRLLNLAVTSAGPVAVDGIYSDDTAALVSAFQSSQAGLGASGIVDLPSWVQIAQSIDLVDPKGTERITLNYDASRALTGEPPLTLVERVQFELPSPQSEPLDGDWTGRPGFWVEIQDHNGTPLYRQILGIDLTLGVEAPSGDPANPWERGESAPDTATLEIYLPILPGGKTLVVFGATTGGPDAPSAVIGTFNL
jgi:hypothetical protein